MLDAMVGNGDPILRMVPSFLESVFQQVKETDSCCNINEEKCYFTP